MEYYIANEYHNHKKEHDKISMSEYDKATWRRIKVYCALMIISCVVIVVAMISHCQIAQYAGMGVCYLAVGALWRIQRKDKKRNIEIDKENKRESLNILEDILIDEFCESDKADKPKGLTSNKIEFLIGLYQKYVDNAEKRIVNFRNIVLSLSIALVGAVASSLSGIGNISLVTWVNFVTFLLVIFSVGSLCVYIGRCYDPTLKMYKTMIKELDELRLYKYVE